MVESNHKKHKWRKSEFGVRHVMLIQQVPDPEFGVWHLLYQHYVPDPEFAFAPLVLLVVTFVR